MKCKPLVILGCPTRRGGACDSALGGNVNGREEQTEERVEEGSTEVIERKKKRKAGQKG
jgi:hypothetical protein